MLEKELQATVIEAAHIGGWRVAHFRTAMNKRGHYMTPVAADGRGFPDLFMLRERPLAIECKSETGRVSVDQSQWLLAFRKAGVEALVCDPDNLDDVLAMLLAKPAKAVS